MIVLTLEPGEAEKLAEGAPDLQRRYGMPIDPAPYPRPRPPSPPAARSSPRACTRPEPRSALLRRLRVRAMAGGLLDDPELIAAAARDVGLDPDELAAWCATRRGRGRAAAPTSTPRAPRRRPPARSTTSSAARARSAATPRRATRSRRRTARTVVDPRLQPGRGLRGGDREPRARPRRAARSRSRSTSCSRWADEPLATAEVAAIMQLRPRGPRRARGWRRRSRRARTATGPAEACARCARARAPRSPRPSPRA